jgi:PIN domain nuclease of toxin-antitoxin system
VSPWEIQIKQQPGKLRLHSNLSDLVETQIERNGLIILPVKLTHIYALGDLPYHHKCPFDRMLIAQAKVESLTLVTVDEQIGQYDVSTLV